VGLRQGEQFEHLVDGAEAPGKNDQRSRQIGEPVLAHEEVVELEVQRRRDVAVRRLFEGQLNVEADGFSAGLEGAAVGGFHDAGAAAGGDDKAMTAGLEAKAPLVSMKASRRASS
jgi:hypothetical protein